LEEQEHENFVLKREKSELKNLILRWLIDGELGLG
jgi:hypothetical protein